MNESVLVSAEEASRALGMAKTSLYRMAAQGVLPSYAVGVRLRGRRFCIGECREALRNLAAQHTQRTEAAR